MPEDQAALLADVRRTKNAVETAEATLAAARREHWHAVAAAHEGKVTLAAIGAELGITRQRVKRLIDSRPDR